jgi:hypothetical protein
LEITIGESVVEIRKEKREKRKEKREKRKVEKEKKPCESSSLFLIPFS